MSAVVKAVLKDGRNVEFVVKPDPPEGGMKRTYFSPDRSYVVQFFKDQSAGRDPNRVLRLENILTKYNPTLPEAQGGARGVTTASAEYFKKLFCWPTGIVVKPEIGIVAPTYPKNYFFASGPWSGQEKNGKWFQGKVRGYLAKMAPQELGTWMNFFSLCILMARAVRRMHQAGLAHSDLSCNNVLVDPTTGQCVVIDIDSLVVPQLFPPDVLGTPGYVAPEVLSTIHLSLNDPKRQHPCLFTDLHALPVLIYGYLFNRHPLDGPKIRSTKSTEEDDFLAMGPQALFIEHPTDHSNRPKSLKIPYTVLGPIMSDLFKKAFVDGLHSPNQRPTAMEWERGMVKTWDLLFPCANKSCAHQMFVLHDERHVRCGFCGTKPSTSTIPILKLRSERRSGQWFADGQLAVYHYKSLFKWHAFGGEFPGEEADRTPQGYFVFHGGKWLLVNQNLASLTSPGGNRVPIGQAVELKDGAQIRLSQESKGKIAEVQIIQA